MTMALEQAVRVTLTHEELARLDALRPSGMSRPAFIRSLLREPPRSDEVATRTEALSILSGLARDGRVAPPSPSSEPSATRPWSATSATS